MYSSNKVAVASLYEVIIRTDELLCTLYCQQEVDGYTCVCLRPVCGEVPEDLQLFIVNKTYGSLEEIRSVAYAILCGIQVRAWSPRAYANEPGSRVLAH